MRAGARRQRAQRKQRQREQFDPEEDDHQSAAPASSIAPVALHRISATAPADLIFAAQRISQQERKKRRVKTIAQMTAVNPPVTNAPPKSIRRSTAPLSRASEQPVKAATEARMPAPTRSP